MFFKFQSVFKTSIITLAIGLSSYSNADELADNNYATQISDDQFSASHFTVS